MLAVITELIERPSKKIEGLITAVLSTREIKAWHNWRWGGGGMTRMELTTISKHLESTYLHIKKYQLLKACSTSFLHCMLGEHCSRKLGFVI